MQKSDIEEPLVYILILNYKGYSNTCECVDSLLRVQYSNYRLLVIDNDSRDGSEERLREKYPYVEIIQTHSNLGFAGGSNIGINYALDRNAEYIGILNNDIIVEENFLNVLVSTMESDREIGIIGPTVCDFFNRDSILSAGGMMSLFSGEGLNICVHKNYKEIHRQIVDCDYVSGCCMLVRGTVIKEIGELPEAYFMYFEETEWCFRARKNGIKVVCDTGAVVWHKESAAIGDDSFLKQYYINRNRVLFIKRNANFMQRFIFFIYQFLQIIYRKATGRRVFWKAIFDGYSGKSGKIDKKQYGEC